MIKRTIHFRGESQLLSLSLTGNSVVAEINGRPFSSAQWPHISLAPGSDFWDLVREEILQIGYGKHSEIQGQILCQLTKQVQEELEHSVSLKTS